MINDENKLDENVEVTVIENTQKEVQEVEQTVDEMTQEIKEEKTEAVKVEEEKNDNQEDGKTVELANNVVEDTKLEESTSLPVDVKPYLSMIKEKLVAFGKATIGVFEKIGEFVENIFKKK